MKALLCKLRGHKVSIGQCPVTGIKAYSCNACGPLDKHEKSKMSFN